MVRQQEFNNEKYCFDKEHLLNAIKKGEHILQSGKLSFNRHRAIKQDIETFKRYLNGNFEMVYINSYNRVLPNDFKGLKDYILGRMQKQYKILGKDLILWVMRLAQAEIFLDNDELTLDTSDLSFESRIELTIKNYEKNSERALTVAKDILLDDTIKQIQLVDDFGSYCYHADITKNSYLIIEREEIPCVLNHELEHCVERKLNYHPHMFYGELGSIYYEMLFNDELYKSRGYLVGPDVLSRIDEVGYLLETLYTYFKVMLLFASKNFDVSLKEFSQAFIEIDGVIPDLLEEYLREEIASDEILDNMNYLFSFLKAIELREKRIITNSSQFNILDHYLKLQYCYFGIPSDGFSVYDRYMEEMSQKVRK